MLDRTRNRVGHGRKIEVGMGEELEGEEKWEKY